MKGAEIRRAYLEYFRSKGHQIVASSSVVPAKDPTLLFINAGMNQGWMTNAFDLDGRARIRYGTVDMGAYEKIHNATIYNFH
mgnify:CR=1 FL=1